MRPFLLGLGMDLVVALNTLILLQILAPGRDGLRVVTSFFRKLKTERWVFLAFLAYWGVMGTNLVLNRLDPLFTDLAGFDFTETLRRMEGAALVRLQERGCPALTTAASVFYFLLFPVLSTLPFVWFIWKGDRERTLRFFAGFLANYVAALPFYLFFPVCEAWGYDGRIQLMPDRVSPALMEMLRPMSAFNNCFPSLHTSLSVTCALVAVEYGRKRLSVICAILSIGTIFSVLYLGIHWISDVLAGIALGLGAYWVTLGELPGWLDFGAIATAPRATLPDKNPVPPSAPPPPTAP